MIDPELKYRIKKVCEVLSYERVFKHFGYRWGGNDTHQLSCPFHARFKDADGTPSEKNPSARYYHKDQAFYCFACAMGGDVVWFIKQHENLKNVEMALAWIEAKFGVTIDPATLDDLTDTTPQDKFPVLSKYYNDQMNDFLYVLKKDKDYTILVYEVTPAIFREKWRLDEVLKDRPYSEAAKRYREWREQAVKRIMTRVDQIRAQLKDPSPVLSS